MGSWQFAYFFPGGASPLAPANAIDVLKEQGFQFEDGLWPLVPVDDEGHLEPRGRVRLVSPYDDLRDRLAALEQFDIECRSRDLFLSCSFATRYANPFISFAWPWWRYRDYPAWIRDRHWALLRRLAKACDATFGIIVEEPPGYFEDKFLELEGRRFLEMTGAHGMEYRIDELWIDERALDPMPELVGATHRLAPIGSVDGYRIHWQERERRAE